MTTIGVIKERTEGEHRVALTPDIVVQLVKLGFDVLIEKGAGEGSYIADADYKEAGAKLEAKSENVLKNANILLCVQPPFADGDDGKPVYASLKKGSTVIGHMNPFENRHRFEDLARHQVTSFAMELVPRITRAQSMDVLSSQSNLAGYKAVIDAVATYGKAIPMMMTAAGKVDPAKVLILGAGVAGLQAIATAKRLGAIVSAFDVRPAVKEQVESLGAKFVEVESEEASDAETSGGYAKEMSKDYQKKQQALIHETIKAQDIVITTAQIPGRPAPELIPEAMVKDMKQGAVIVDLATATGGNCPLSERGKVVTKHGVTLVGYDNMPSRVAADASKLYAKNLFNFIKSQWNEKEEKFTMDMEDEITKGALISYQGKIMHPLFVGEAVTSGKKINKSSTSTKQAKTPRKVLDRKPHLKKRTRQGQS